MSDVQAQPVMNLQDIETAFSALCPACEKAVREALLKCLARKKDATPRGLSLLRRQIANQYGLDEMYLLEHSHRAGHVQARREFCRRARAEGHSLEEIGAAINRHHTSVLSMLRSNGWKSGR